MMKARMLFINVLSIFVSAVLFSAANAVDFNILFKGDELQNSMGGPQGVEVWGRGHVSGDQIINMHSAGTYDVVTTWAQGNPRNLYGKVTVDSNGDVTGVTGALVMHDSKTVGFDKSELTAITVECDTLNRGFQNLWILGVNGYHSAETTFYLPDGTYYPSTGWVPSHLYYGSFTVGGGGIASTDGSMTLSGPNRLTFDLASLNKVTMRGDLHTTANGIKMQYGINGVGNINRTHFGSLDFYVPDGYFTVVTGWGPGHHHYGYVDVNSGNITASGALLVNGSHEVEVDHSKLNAITVTPVDNYLWWVFNEQTQGRTDDSTVDTVFLPNGGYRATIRKLDSSTITASFSVVDGVLDQALLPASNPLIEISTNNNPVADAGVDQEVECEQPAGALVTLDASFSFDIDGDSLEYQWNVPTGIVLDDATSASPSGVFPPGITLATLTVTDGNGGVDIDDVQIAVVDTTPPEVSCTTDKGLLWPPNHRMEMVNIYIDATDNCSNPQDLILLEVTVTSSEPDDSEGDGDGTTTGDVDFEDGYAAPVDVTSSFAWNFDTESYDGQIALRAERSGEGNGRTYTINAVVLDSSSNIATTSCVVVVPHDRRGKKK